MNSEEFMQFLEHAEFYDPEKAHEYYIRTRQLKGRRHGSQPDSSPGNGFNGTPNKGVVVRTKAPQSKVQLQAHADQRTAALKARIAHLKQVLERLVEEAKRRSGVETPKKHDTHKPSTQAKSQKKPAHHHETEKEKRAKEKYNKEHRKPAKPAQTPTDKELQNQIHQLREKIATIRRQLKAAVQDARPHSGTNRSSGQPVASSRQSRSK